jgi:hypothetical protein
VYVYVNKDPTFTNSTNLITGISESSPYVITYDKLFTTFPSADDSTGILGYQISNVTTGVTAGSTLQSYVSGVLTTVTAPYTMYPGDQVIWTPPQYQNIAAYPTHQIFKLKLLDGNGATSTEIDVKGTVTSVNDAPVILSASSLSSVAKNATKTITYDDIFAAIDFREYDINTSAKPALGDLHGISFRIESVNSGTLIGSNGTSIAPTPGNTASMKSLVKSGSQDLSSSWYSTTWTPPANLAGTYTVMKVRLFDGQAWSNTVASINITVTAGNTTPTATVASFTVSPGISENGAQIVTYDNLMGYTGAGDADGDLVKFKVVNLNSGSLKINGTTYSTVGAIAAQPQIGPGESFIWYPANNVNGTLSAFNIKLTDTVADSTAITASVLVGNYNTAPTNNASLLISGTRYPNASVIVITHSALRTGLAVADDTDAATAVTFRVESLEGGQGLNYASTGNCASPTSAAVAGSTSINSTQDLCWIPPAGVVGTYDAFKVSVIDSNGAQSPTVATIQVTLTGSDTAPAYYGSYPASPTYNVVQASGTVTWTYEQLKGLVGAYDTDSNAISLMVTYVNPTVVGTNIGSLVKNGGVALSTWGGSLGGARTSATVNNGNIIVPGESITFQSLSSAGTVIGTSYEAFRFAAVDSTTVASTAKSIYITPQNASTDYNPNFTYVGPVPIGSKQTATVNEITYAQFLAETAGWSFTDPSGFRTSTKRQALSLDSGRVSWMRTKSPTWARLVSSWAYSFLKLVTTLRY